MKRARLALTLSFGAGSVLNYVFSLALGWLLIPGDFGVVAFAQTLILVGGILLSSGVPWALARTMATVPETDHPALVRGALLVNGAVGGLSGALVLGLFALGPLEPGLETWPVALLVAGSLVLISVAAASRGALQGVERFGSVAAVQTVEVAAKALFGLVLVAAGLGVAGAVAGFAAGSALASLVGAERLARMGIRMRGAVRWPELGQAGPMLLSLVGFSLLLNLDLVALKLISDDRDLAGHYQAALVLANAPYFLISATYAPVLFQRLAQLTDARERRAATLEALRGTLLIAVPIELVLAAAPGTALSTLFPDEYAAGASALRILALANVLLVAALIVNTAMRATGQAGSAARRILVVVALEPFLLAALVPPLGIDGAAIAFGVATAAVLALIAAPLRATSGTAARGASEAATA